MKVIQKKYVVLLVTLLSASTWIHAEQESVSPFKHPGTFIKKIALGTSTEHEEGMYKIFSSGIRFVRVVEAAFKETAKKSTKVNLSETSFFGDFLRAAYFLGTDSSRKEATNRTKIKVLLKIRKIKNWYIKREKQKLIDQGYTEEQVAKSVWLIELGGRMLTGEATVPDRILFASISIIDYAIRGTRLIAKSIRKIAKKDTRDITTAKAIETAKNALISHFNNKVREFVIGTIDKVKVTTAQLKIVAERAAGRISEVLIERPALLLKEGALSGWQWFTSWPSYTKAVDAPLIEEEHKEYSGILDLASDSIVEETQELLEKATQMLEAETISDKTLETFTKAMQGTASTEDFLRIPPEESVTIEELSPTFYKAIQEAWINASSKELIAIGETTRSAQKIKSSTIKTREEVETSLSPTEKNDPDSISVEVVSTTEKSVPTEQEERDREEQEVREREREELLKRWQEEAKHEEHKQKERETEKQEHKVKAEVIR